MVGVDPSEGKKEEREDVVDAWGKERGVSLGVFGFQGLNFGGRFSGEEDVSLFRVLSASSGGESDFFRVSGSR